MRYKPSMRKTGHAISRNGTEYLRNIPPDAKTRNGHYHRCRTSVTLTLCLYGVARPIYIYIYIYIYVADAKRLDATSLCDYSYTYS